MVTRILPGDSLFGLALPKPGGELLHFASQWQAGRAVVLWIAEHPEDDQAARLAAQAAAFSAVEALVYCVVPGRPASAAGSDLGAEVPVLDVPVLLDPERRLVGALGLEDRGVVVLDANLRLAAVLPGGDFEAALALCTEIFQRTAPTTLRAQAPALTVPGVLEPELCRALIACWEAGDKTSDRVSVTGTRDKYAMPEVKKRADILLDDRQLLAAFRARVERRLVPEIFKAFAYKVSRFEGPRIGCYDGAHGGYFRRHRDNTTPSTAGRRFAVSINLNGGDYLGGELRFPEYSRALYAPETGGAVVFSCALLHEALPVTEGRRFGVFTFAYEETGTGPRTANDPANDHPGQ